MGGICYLNRHNVYVPYTDGFLDGYNEGIRECYRLRNCINCIHLRISNEFSCMANKVVLSNLYGCGKWEQSMQ